MDPGEDPLRKRRFGGLEEQAEIRKCLTDPELWRDLRLPRAGAVSWIKSQNLRLERAAPPPTVGEGTGTAEGCWIPCSGHAWRLCLAPLPGAGFVWESSGTDNAQGAKMSPGTLQQGYGAEPHGLA